MIYYELIYAVACIVLAKVNADLIKDGKRIYHALNGLLHIAIAAGGWFLFGWMAFPIILLLARIVFNTALNLFRRLNIFYVTPEIRPKSIVARVEKNIFGMNGFLPFAIYFVAFLLLNVIYQL